MRVRKEGGGERCYKTRACPGRLADEGTGGKGRDGLGVVGRLSIHLSVC